MVEAQFYLGILCVCVLWKQKQISNSHQDKPIKSLFLWKHAQYFISSVTRYLSELTLRVVRAETSQMRLRSHKYKSYLRKKWLLQ